MFIKAETVEETLFFCGLVAWDLQALEAYALLSDSS